ncbi:hypothetical protein BGX38DRAFT_1328967 [Terfezia claveryi]|nr:hypothetical protein BGX38DRAFT_1328967 [Terfezia claveryi]
MSSVNKDPELAIKPRLAALLDALEDAASIIKELQTEKWAEQELRALKNLSRHGTHNADIIEGLQSVLETRVKIMSVFKGEIGKKVEK